MSKKLPVKTPHKRRQYSASFKARILAACEQPGASVAGVALANGLNTNLVHNWRRIAKAQPAEASAPASSDFIPVPITVPDQHHSNGESVMLEVGQIKAHWPLTHIDRAIDWLRLLQS